MLVKIDNPTIIDCDEYLIDNKEEYLQFINNLIGGYSDLLTYLKIMPLMY